jgi:benzylsuccinate CoA-transferase BbsF subunit
VRWTNRRELDLEIATWTSTRSREEVTRVLQAAGVAAFPSYTAQDIVDDAHLKGRGTIKAMAGPEGESRNVVGPPWLFSRTPAALTRWIPRLGEHNEYVLGELLGLAPSEIRELIAAKVIY